MSRRDSSTGAVAVGALLVASALAGALAVGAAAGANQTSVYASVTDVSTDPGNPGPGDLVTVRATVRNLENSPSIYTVNAVAMRPPSKSSEFFEYDRVTDLGTLAPGSEMTVPLTVRFSDPGTRQIRIIVYGKDEDGDPVNVQYPLVVRVQDRAPQVNVETDSTVVGTDGVANVTVANGLAEDVRNAEVTLRAPGVTVENPRRIASTIPAGSTRSFRFTYTPRSAGQGTLNATLRYRTPDGLVRRTAGVADVRFRPLLERVSLNATAASNGRAVAVRVSNAGNAAVENVTVRGSAPNATVSQALVDRIPSNAVRSVRLNLSDVTGDGSVPVRVDASYAIGDRAGSRSTTVRVTRNPASIELTGVELERDGDRIHVVGSASNVGLTRADSVVVRVRSAEGVSPAYPAREYFVGTVPASDFVSFDVYARVDPGVDEIPLEVTYLTDGERRRRAVTVPNDLQGTTPGGGGGTTPATPFVLVGGAVVVIVLAFVVLAWRNYRAGP